MILLTLHSINRLKSRIFKKKDVNIFILYKKVIDIFLKAKIEHYKDTYFFNWNKYTFVLKKAKVKFYEKKKILQIVDSFFDEFEYFIFILNNNVAWVNKEKVLGEINKLPDRKYCFIFSKEAKLVYVGEKRPFVLLTVRPKESKIFFENNVWLLSIKKKFGNKILNKEKKFELRKSIPKRLKPGDIIFIYLSKERKIAGYFIVKNIKKIDVDNFWGQKDLGINREEYFRYFMGYKNGYAIEIDKIYKIDPISLDEIRLYFPRFKPPINFMNLSDRRELLEFILNKIKI